MNIKTKLSLGVGSLFLMIVLLTILSIWYVNQLAADANNITENNYQTLDYCRKMMNSLNTGALSQEDKKTFAESLQKQEKTITEIGELDLTNQLSSDFRQLIRDSSNTNLIKKMRKDISSIMLLNLQAIQRKSEVANRTAEQARFWLSLVGSVCFLLAFVMLVNLPGNIANPIAQLTESIKEIAAQNYAQRVHYSRQNEFGELASSFNTMAEKLQEYKTSDLDKLMMEKQRIDTLINNMNEPIIGVDEQETVLFINNTALKITGLTAIGALGKKLGVLAEKNDLIRTLQHDLMNASSPKSSATQPVKIYADNKESYFEKEIVPINITPTGEQTAVRIGTVIILQNVTPYKELDTAKTNFIATVSHELKTPIAAIKMGLELLKNKNTGSLNGEQQLLVESIEDDAKRLLKITSELLNLTQVESGAIRLSLQKSDANHIIDDAVAAIKTLADQKRVSLSVNLPDNLPTVLADKEKTTWVLINLLSNAIRYSYEDSVVEVSAAVQKQTLKISVTDAGQGISSEYLPKIFNRYFQIPGNSNEGTGLGLSICKEFLDAQGGQIEAESDLGAGSQFSFTLQLSN